VIGGEETKPWRVVEAVVGILRQGADGLAAPIIIEVGDCRGNAKVDQWAELLSD
jgi:hypothetical protein